MKKMYLFMFVFALIASAYGQETTNLEKEREAIKAVILEETQSYCDRDFERYAATYKHDESNVDLRAYSTSYYHVVGWEANSYGIKNFIEENPEPVKNSEVKKNFDIHVYPGSAWAIFENEFYDDQGKFVDMDIGVNFLEKIDGKWKIVYLSRVGATTYGGDFEVIEVSEEALTKYLGKYELQPGFIIEVLLEDSQLIVHPTGQQRMHLYAYEEHKFFLKTVDAQLEFNFEGDKVVSLTLHQNGENLALKVE
jgi:hypothetical protein